VVRSLPVNNLAPIKPHTAKQTEFAALTIAVVAVDGFFAVSHLLINPVILYDVFIH
jgi:hypothetical protein